MDGSCAEPPPNVNELLLNTPGPTPASFGWCSRCNTEHRLQQGPALESARELMLILEDRQRIDLASPDTEADPRFSTDYLFGEARGQMFGVLECENSRGQAVTLRAFSCQYNAAWQVEGWVPPLFDTEAYDRIMIPGDGVIKELGRQMEICSPDSEEHRFLKLQRRNLSRSLMKQLHALYELRNFSNQTQPLTAFYRDVNGIPTGAGDCCAPKLLNHAARNNLRPLGLAEFYWGKTNRSGTREHGQFYSSCSDKCQPILGFMLCGAGS